MSTSSLMSRSRSALIFAAPRALSVAAVFCLALAGCGSRDTAEQTMTTGYDYRFIPAENHLVRVETTTGQVSFSNLLEDGAKHWVPLGDAPPADEHPIAIDRFDVRRLPSRRVGGTTIVVATLIRLDHETGRTWTAAVKPGNAWLKVADPTDSTLDEPRTDESAEPSPDPVVPAMPTDKVETTPEKAAEHVATYTSALEREDLPPSMKIWAVGQLGRYDAELSGAALRKALRSRDPEIVIAAIGALKNLDDASAIPEILKLKAHSDPRVRAAVEAAMVDER